MVLREENRNGHSEEFDVARLAQIADMALKGKVPNGSFSDLECNVWELFRWTCRHAAKGEFKEV